MCLFEMKRERGGMQCLRNCTLAKCTKPMCAQNNRILLWVSFYANTKSKWKDLPIALSKSFNQNRFLSKSKIVLKVSSFITHLQHKAFIIHVASIFSCLYSSFFCQSDSVASASHLLCLDTLNFHIAHTCHKTLFK